MRAPYRFLALCVAMALASIGVLTIVPESALADDDATASEAWRPLAHYAPEKNWMNDPNGLVYENGTYHLFYQHNPYGLEWGNMSWGHATSPDLIHWTEQEVAIPATDAYGVFSGSAVYDENNTSGLGTAQAPPIVAVWTRADTATGIQAQSLSYSTDHGATWTNYNDGAPVLDIGSREFRDPKVFWDDVSGKWIMVAVVATEHKVVFYSSNNLIDWAYESEVGGIGDTTAVWECPDLFPLQVDCGDQTKWVLSVSIAGGVGRTKYFTGDWDGSVFTPDPLPSYDGSEGEMLANFDSGSWDGWVVDGSAFSKEPATGSWPDQLPVAGYEGSGFVNTFYDAATGRGSDATTGTATSPEFTINADYLNMRIGGGNHPYDPVATGDDGGGTLFAGFDSGTWEGWSVEGDAFSAAPATGGWPDQLPLGNQRGAGLINTFYDAVTGRGSDATTGTATSPEFTINAPYINLNIGGGYHTADSPSERTTVELVVDGQVVRTATGRDTEVLNWQSWDVTDLNGKTATIVVTDAATGGWGHILLDEVRLGERPATPVPSHTSVNVVVDGEVVGSATGNQSELLAWQSIDLRQWKGRQASIVIEDANTSGDYGHILVDSILASNTQGFSGADAMPIIDHGMDYYAAVTWNHTPDGERYGIGWMSHWSYAGALPTSTWRQAMTMVRKYELRTVNGQVQLVSSPVEALDTLRTGESFSTTDVTVSDGADVVLDQGAAGNAYDMEVVFDPGSASRSGVKVLASGDEATVIGYDAQAGTVYVDRTNSGRTSFSPAFPSVSSAPVKPDADGLIHLRVLVDRSSVEVFAGSGEAVITSAVYPSPQSTNVILFSEGGEMTVRSMAIHHLGDYHSGDQPTPTPTPAPTGDPATTPPSDNPTGGASTQPVATPTSAGSSSSPSLATTGVRIGLPLLLAVCAIGVGLRLMRRRT